MSIELFQSVGVTKGQKIINIGFRDFGELKLLADLVGSHGKVIGIDIDTSSINLAQKRLNELSDYFNISIQEGTILKIPVNDDTLDLILCKGILHEVKELEKAFFEMARVCRKGGIISIKDFQKVSRLKFKLYRFLSWVKGFKNEDFHPGFTRTQLQEIIQTQSLKEIKYQELPIIWNLGFIKARVFLLMVQI